MKSNTESTGLSVPARPHEPTEREALARTIMRDMAVEDGVQIDYAIAGLKMIYERRAEAAVNAMIAAGWRRVPSALPPTQPESEEQMAAFELAQIAAWAEMPEAPHWNLGRLARLVSKLLRIVSTEDGAGLASLPPVPSEPPSLQVANDAFWAARNKLLAEGCRFSDAHLAGVAAVLGLASSLPAATTPQVRFTDDKAEPCPAGYERHMWVSRREPGQQVAGKECAHCYTRLRNHE